MERGDIATATPARVRWIAGADGTAHAHRREWQHRTACAQRAVEERWSHPASRLCPECIAVLEREGIAA